MSRIGLKPLDLPAGVSLTQDGRQVNVTGPKGSIDLALPNGIEIKQEADTVSLSRTGQDKSQRSLHGLSRALLASAVQGVSQGYEVKLEIQGVGFKVNVTGQQIKLWLGRSHEQTFELPEGVTANVDQNTLTIAGIDKAKVGQAAAAIRSLKKPEPYKGKGIRFTDEYVIRKSGKAAVTGKE